MLALGVSGPLADLVLLLAASATGVRSTSRKIATIFASVNRLFLIGSLLSRGYLPRNHWSEETEQASFRRESAAGKACAGGVSGYVVGAGHVAGGHDG